MAEGNWSDSVLPSQSSIPGYASDPSSSISTPFNFEHFVHGNYQDSLRGHSSFHTSQANTLSFKKPQPINMPTFGSMSSADLIAAALTPRTNHRSQQTSPSLPHPSQNTMTPMSMLPNRTNSRLLASSPIPHLVVKDYPDGFERHYQSYAADIQNTKSRKRSRSSLSAIEQDQGQDDADAGQVSDMNEEPADEKELVKVPKTRSTRRGQNADEDEGSEYEDRKKSAKKKARKARTPRKTQKRLIRRKPQGIKVPETLEFATAPDKMMWQWKNAGKNWEEIRNEWQRLTGTKPGSSSLSVRYIKLNENFAHNGAAGDQELMKYKAEAESELLSGLWERVAEKMKAHNDLSEHNPKDLKKRYDLIVRSNFDLIKVNEDDTLKKEPTHVNVPTPHTSDHHQEDTNIQPHLRLLTGPITPVRVFGPNSTDRKVEAGTPNEDDFTHLLPHFNESISGRRDEYMQYDQNAQTFPSQNFSNHNNESTMVHPRMGQDFPHMTPSPANFVTFPASSPLNKGLVSYNSDSD